MEQKRTVIIGGREYDRVSGLPIGDAAPQKAVEKPTHHTEALMSRTPQSHAATIHTHTQKSTTLRRAALKKPVKLAHSSPKKTLDSVHAITHHKQPLVARAATTKSTHISKFTSRPATTIVNNDIAPIRHPHVVKAQAKIDAKRTPAPEKTAQEIKREAIEHAISTTGKHKQPKKRYTFKHPGAMSIVTAALALVVLGGYLTYLNMPSLSVRVAAVAAGVDASYPNYRPDGYRLDGAVAYNKGEVSMKFAANAGPQNFTIKQSKSSWDSAAVLDNYVKPKAGTDYATFTDHGLTIYTFDNGVAWVNGGILYTIDGDARLSSDQIRHIATSFM